ncbi:BRCT domain-containing DNA repair protein [Gossypium australe]|uniref:BRCT domain-containing DNA repair protein n=1 Tax=Gossypium australe TaxID=47621 RepID=A0A5B6VGR5_9ROSI|nr:BRCT domain-containing DNA repair protein [Gossypium australe]
MEDLDLSSTGFPRVPEAANLVVPSPALVLPDDDGDLRENGTNSAALGFKVVTLPGRSSFFP